jgi:predicted aspartyl protease
MRCGRAFCGLSAVTYLAMSMCWASDQQRRPANERPIGIQVLENGRLLVPVAVNGNKQRWFLFDTGATITVLSEKLAKKAGIAANGVRQVVTFAGPVSLSIGQAETLSVGNHSTGRLTILIADLGRLFNLEPQIEGIIGQDVLCRFNYLLDRLSGRLDIEEGGHSLELAGTRVSCQKRGGKMYVPAAGGELLLPLDSGIPYLRKKCWTDWEWPRRLPDP